PSPFCRVADREFEAWRIETSERIPRVRESAAGVAIDQPRPGRVADPRGQRTHEVDLIAVVFGRRAELEHRVEVPAAEGRPGEACFGPEHPRAVLEIIADLAPVDGA